MSATIRSGAQEYEVRPEGSGYLFHVHDSGSYLYTTPFGHEIVRTLLDGASHDELILMVSRRLGIPPELALPYITTATSLLSGDVPGERCESVNRERLGVWLLEEMMGPQGERCETFGMPF